MITANPWTGLGARSDAPPARRVNDEDVDGMSKTGRMRETLRERGPCSASDLAEAAGLASTGLVGALLKHDMKIGRVRFSGGLYSLSEGFDEDGQAEIEWAVSLLRRKGYEVREP